MDDKKDNLTKEEKLRLLINRKKWDKYELDEILNDDGFEETHEAS